jgi:hypothetical protein
LENQLTMLRKTAPLVKPPLIVSNGWKIFSRQTAKLAKFSRHWKGGDQQILKFIRLTPVLSERNEQKLQHGLFHNLQNGFKRRIFGIAEQFKQNHFRAGQLDAFALHAAQGKRFIGRIARRNGIGNGINFVAGFQQMHGGLVNTDVGFDAAENDVATTGFF